MKTKDQKISIFNLFFILDQIKEMSLIIPTYALCISGAVVMCWVGFILLNLFIYIIMLPFGITYVGVTFSDCVNDSLNTFFPNQGKLLIIIGIVCLVIALCSLIVIYIILETKEESLAKRLESALSGEMQEYSNKWYDTWNIGLKILGVIAGIALFVWLATEGLIKVIIGIIIFRLTGIHIG